MRYVDIAVLSNDIHQKLSLDCDEPMPISVTSDSSNCIKNKISLYLDDKFPINLYSTDILINEHLGMYLKYNNKIDIHISSSLNHCWSRFVSTKELMHSILSQHIPESKTTDIENLIKHIISKDEDFKPDQEVEPEYSAWILAVEVLLPYCFNDLVIDEKQYTSYQIADIFKVPEVIVDRVRTKDYQDFRKKCYED
jgi:Zn-dependent peptidase ImmA (M78 family)